MLARGLRLLLALELAAYLLAGYWLVHAGHAGPAGAAAALAALALAGRAAVIGTTFALARFHRAPVPEGARLKPLQAVRMALEEYLAFILLFTVVQPFERLFMGTDRMRPAQDRPPLLLVHGYECNRAFWWRLRPRLERAGWLVATVNLEPVFAGIDAYADVIARRIGEVCRATGARAVILVAHSMGGLAARAYLRRHGRERVARLVTLGSPHAGSRLAPLGIGENARQMVPGSVWLAELNGARPAPLPPHSVSLYSYHDNYVMPQSSACLAGARNVPVAGVGHLAMACNGRFARCLLEELARPTNT